LDAALARFAGRERDMTHSELPITASNLGYVEELYAQYVENPNSVEERWRLYFQSMDDDAGFA
jgi:2-oxoglutarate dehydrogenase complex dehydrogenase (E1) component-like enzyme